MNRTTAILVVSLFITGTAYAQNSADVQAGATTQSQSGVSASADRSGIQSSGNASAAGTANASANDGRNNFGLAEGSTMNAALSNSLDAKKAKAGDRVVAHTTENVKQDGKVVVPKGTRLVGHVTQVQARGKDSAQSSLGVVFDHAELRNGEQVPLNAGIQALAESRAAAQTAASGGGDDLAAAGNLGGGGGGRISGGGHGGGLVGGAAGGATGTLSNVSSGTTSAVGNVGGAASGVGSAAGGVGGAVGATAGAATRTTGSIGGLNAAGVLTSNSRGVFGLDGLSLDSAASSATQGAVIVSNTKNVHLDSGTQMLLNVAAAK